MNEMDDCEDVIYLTTQELADRFRTSASSVRDWRARGDGPLGVRFGNKNVLYPLPEVEAWEQQQIDAARREHERRASPYPAPTSVRAARGGALRSRGRSIGRSS